MLPILDKYLDWWQANELYPTDMVRYRGRQPTAHFIVNDKFSHYSLSGRPEKGYGANPMSRKLKQLIDNTGIEGATPSTFRDSFIRLMYQAGCPYKDLMDVTGIKQKQTLDRKIKPHEKELNQVYKEIFRGVL